MTNTLPRLKRVLLELVFYRKWPRTPVFLPGEFQGQESLVGYSPWGHKESDLTEKHTHTHTHTNTQRSCFGKKAKSMISKNPWRASDWKFSLVTHYKDLKSVSKHAISVHLFPLLSSFIYKHLSMKNIFSQSV